MDEQLRRATVVVGIDGSKDALRAVRWGAAEAERSRTPLRLVTAFGLPVGDPHGRLHTAERYRRAMLDRAHRHLAEATVVAAQEGRRIAVEQEVLVGHPVSVLGRESRHARVVVIGDRGQGRIEGVPVGSVAVGLAVHAQCPVVVVRGGASDALGGPVVVGVAGVGNDEAALAFAFDAAAARHVPLVAVHAWSDPMADPMTRSAADLVEIESIEGGRMAERLTRWVSKCPDVVLEQVVAEGAAARILLDGPRALSCWWSAPAGGASSPACCWARSATRCCTARRARWPWSGPPRSRDGAVPPRRHGVGVCAVAWAAPAHIESPLWPASPSAGLPTDETGGARRDNVADR